MGATEGNLVRIAVAGGTGLAGRLVVDRLQRDGHDPVVLARARGVDLMTGEGLAAALKGADVVVDVTSVTTTSARKSVGFFGTATDNLLQAAQNAGVGHHVALSIVGIERVKSAYYLGKIRQEELIRAGGVPWTILRATQFHEFADQVLSQVPGPIAVVPVMRTQPIAVREVAEHLCAIATGAPQQMADEIAGPNVESLVDMARRLIKRRNQRRPVVPLRLPGHAARAAATGALLPEGPGPRGTQTFDQWLREQGS